MCGCNIMWVAFYDVAREFGVVFIFYLSIKLKNHLELEVG